jgi:CRP-like cAMP-binding protein
MYTLQEILEDPRFSESNAWQRRPFKVNELIFDEGDAGKTFFYIEKGGLTVTIQVELENRKTIKAGIFDLQQGDIFGEMCLYRSRFRTASVTAVTDGCLLEIEGEKLSVYLDDNPIQGYLFYKQLFEVVAERLSRANRRAETLLAWGFKVHEIDKYF